jgi:phosphatidylinositol 4-kinase
LAEDQTEDLPEIVPEREIIEEEKQESGKKLQYSQLAAHYETGIPEIRRPRAVTIMYVYDNDPDTPSAPVPQPTEASETKTASVFGESIEEQAARIKAASPYRDLKTWELLRVIVKSGDDLRQEQLAMQLITQFQEIFKHAELNLWLRPYEIIATGKDCGLIECVDAMSIDSIKKSAPTNVTSLAQFFEHHFGPVRSKAYREAQRCFIQSLAGYSLLCFVLQIKDRHNGNILLDREGHLVHIDFGFMISNSPGGDFKFEKAPFKLTDEYVGVMEGVRSSHFQDFRKLCVK